MKPSVVYSLTISLALLGACASHDDALEPPAEQALIEAGFSEEAVDDLRLALEVEPELGAQFMGTSAANACVGHYRNINSRVKSGTSNGRVYATFQHVSFGLARLMREAFVNVCTDECGGTVISSYAATSLGSFSRVLGPVSPASSALRSPS